MDRTDTGSAKEKYVHRHRLGPTDVTSELLGRCTT